MPKNTITRHLLHGIWWVRSYLTRPQWRRLHPLISNPKIVALEVILVGAWLFFGRGDEPISLALVWTKQTYTVSERYLGVAIDAAMVTDGEWWENSDSPPRPLDFKGEQLRHWASLLKPDWVRLGGTEADKLWLAEPEDDLPSVPLLFRPLFTDYLDFTRAIEAKPFITVSAGPVVRKNDEWQPDQFQRLLSWLPDDFDGHLEFGNEPGAHWLIFGRQHQISFKQFAQEYQEAQTLANEENILLAGPANAFWPEIGEPLKQVFGSSKDFLQAGANPDIFTWHYYPTQSSRCGVKTEGADWESLLDVETLQEFEKRNRIIREWLKDYSPDSIQWLGETGPAQCGGKAKLTDRFGASLWWLSHLGLAAQGGNQTVIRQSLVGGDYALLRYNQGYSPNPDFWASVLWQQNMGAKGFRVAETGGLIRAFAHCHRLKPDTMSMVIINLSSQPASVELPQARTLEFIDITSHDLTSRYTFVEQQLAEVLDWQDPDALPWQAKSDWRAMPAYSYRWVNIPNVHQCGDSTGSSI